MFHFEIANMCLIFEIFILLVTNHEAPPLLGSMVFAKICVLRIWMLKFWIFTTEKNMYVIAQKQSNPEETRIF